MSLDSEKIISQALVEISTSFFESLKENSIDFFSKKYSYLFEDFNNYLEVTYNKCNSVRTIINKDKSFILNEIYVAGSFTCGKDKYSDVELIQKIRDGRPSVVLGFGGIGKTIFMKYLWLCVFAEPGGRIPIFLELRRLNQLTDIDLKTYVRRSLTPTEDGIDTSVFDQFLKDGRFVFIFDGFDELNNEKKSRISDEVLNISYNFPNNGYVISSRYDERFFSWERFETYRADYFTKDQVVELIDKITYDKETKNKFKEDILNKKYETFKSFLATPLLSLMMLMTYSQFSEVPERRSIFYKYAFLTLYSWHDSSKEAFNREKQSGLLFDQFEKVFSVFCLVTYLDGVYNFTESEILKYLDKSKKYIEFDFEPRRILKEIVNNVNLMYIDGDQYLFTHRSFQEYFTAFATVNYFYKKMIEIVPRVSRDSDIVLSLMYGINQSVVTDYYMYPQFKEKKKSIDEVIKIRDIDDLAKFFGFKFLVGIRINDDGKNYLNLFGDTNSNEASGLIQILSRLLDNDYDTGKIKKYSIDHKLYSELENIVYKSRRTENFEVGNYLFAYEFGEDAIYYTPIEFDSFSGFDEAFRWIKENGSKLNANVEKLEQEVRVKATNLKAIYVTVQRATSSIVRSHAKKERDIDELLG